MRVITHANCCNLSCFISNHVLSRLLLSKRWISCDIFHQLLLCIVAMTTVFLFWLSSRNMLFFLLYHLTEWIKSRSKIAIGNLKRWRHFCYFNFKSYLPGALIFSDSELFASKSKKLGSNQFIDPIGDTTLHWSKFRTIPRKSKSNLVSLMVNLETLCWKSFCASSCLNFLTA